MRKEDYPKIKEMYLQGVSGLQIAATLGLNDETVKRILRRWRASGEVPAVKPKWKKRESKPRKKKVINVPNYDPTIGPRRIAESTLKPGETIRCTVAVSKTCVYGIDGPRERGLCRFSSVTGKCRSVGDGACSHNKCTRYSKISKSNPRLKGGD